jgi:hypothetical protein
MRPRPIVKNRGFISPCRRRNPSLDLSTWQPWRCYVSWLGPDCEARVGLGLNSDLVLFNKIHLDPYPGRRQIQTDQHLQCYSVTVLQEPSRPDKHNLRKRQISTDQHLLSIEPTELWKLGNLGNTGKLGTSGTLNS